MLELWKWFLGYLKISYTKIIWIFLFAGILWVVFTQLRKIEFLKTQAGVKKNPIGGFMFAFACSLICVMTLCGRARKEYGFEFIPFSSYVMVYKTGNMELLLQIVANIVMYIPLGVSLILCFAIYNDIKYVFLTALICSTSIELIQGFAQIGLFELDDICNNVIGATIGAVFTKCIRNIKKNDKVLRSLH